MSIEHEGTEYGIKYMVCSRINNFVVSAKVLRYVVLQTKPYPSYAECIGRNDAETMLKSLYKIGNRRHLWITNCCVTICCM